MDALIRDVRFAVRGLLRQRALTAAAVTMMAMAIGASTSVFTVADAVMFEIPFDAPGRIVTIRERNRTSGRTRSTAPDHFVAWRSADDVLEATAAYTLASPVLTDPQGAERLSAEVVTADLFKVLGARPRIGRVLSESDEHVGSTPVAVLSHRMWAGRFGSDPAVIGQTITLDGVSTTVVGVMPSGFDGPRSRSGVELWLPLSDVGTPRSSVMVYGRVRAGVSVAAAEARIDAISRALPGGSEWGAWLVPSTAEDIYEEVRSQILMLGGAVALVLIIACANVTSLLLGRNVARRRELAIRTAIGASRRHLLRQLLIESLLLTGAGSLAGLLVTSWTLSVIPSLLPGWVPRAEQMDVDISVILFAVLMAAATGFVVALLPALSTGRANLVDALKTGIDAGGARRAARIRTGLVIAEASIALIVLTAAMLLIGSFLRLNPTRPGFALDNRVTFSLRFNGVRYQSPDARATAVETLARSLAGLPGVSGVSASTSLPLSGSVAVFPMKPVHAVNATPSDVFFHAVLPPYLSEMEIPILRGRDISASDGRGAEPVAVVTEAFARRYFTDRDPLGGRIEIEEPGGPVIRRIVGVAGDIRSFGGDLRYRPEVFVPYGQSPLPFVRLVLKAQQPPPDLAARIRQAVSSRDPTLPVDRIRTLRDIASESIRPQRFLAWMMAAFAATALVLAWVGVYAMAGWAVAQRTREFAVRIAVGARPADIRRIVLRYGLVVGTAGAVAGSVGGIASTRVIESWLFGLPAAQPLWRLLMATSFVVLTTIACYVPARRAMRLDPLHALRSE